MRVRFWGTRGSIPKPGPGTVRHGGNTSCVEVRTASGTLVVVDCGTGAHELGRALVAEARAAGRPVRGHLLITHTHWDHIQGIPFFAPFFEEGCEWDVYAPRGLAQSVRETLAGQMQYTYFPVTLEELGATIRYHDLVEGELRLGGEGGDVRVRARYLNHPALTLGYRLEADGAVLAYACDHEPFDRRLASGEEPITGRDRDHAAFLAGADLVIHDAPYTAAEYPEKAGWGHSTHEYAAAVCRLAGARRLALTHHDPFRGDDALDCLVAALRRRLADEEGSGGDVLDVFAASEGTVIELRGLGGPADGPGPGEQPTPLGGAPAAERQPTTALADQVLLLAVAEPEAAASLARALEPDGVLVVGVATAAAALAAFEARKPSVVVLGRRLPDGDGLELCRALRRLDGGVPIVVAARAEEPEAGAAAGVTDWLALPFSAAYARTKVRAWLLGSRPRWAAAALPPDEERRLAGLALTGLLDTSPEERFDRVTRLAAALFGVPMALVTLVDRDRQWLKSCHGPLPRETSREASFCAHAILEPNRPTVVRDALLDDRFADNPLVAGDPRIRFYAGVPLLMPGHGHAGTLCILDTRPRELAEDEARLLHDLAAIVQRELG